MAARMQYLCVRFSEPAEYVAELERDKDLVERGLVRVTHLVYPVANGAVQRVILKAAAIVEGRPVILERFVGDLWGQREADDKVRQTLTRVAGELEDGLLNLGLEVRGGDVEQRSTVVERVAPDA